MDKNFEVDPWKGPKQEKLELLDGRLGKQTYIGIVGQFCKGRVRKRVKIQHKPQSRFSMAV